MAANQPRELGGEPLPRPRCPAPMTKWFPFVFRFRGPVRDDARQSWLSTPFQDLSWSLFVTREASLLMTALAASSAAFLSVDRPDALRNCLRP
jgi:hypothetical protein